jgi:ribosomal protein S18 acetylase RimI-like enzyme
VTGGPVTIRRAQRDDIPAIRKIHRAAWSLAYRGIVPDAAIEAATGQPDAAWAAAIAEERPGLFVALRAGVVVGWLRLVGTMIKSLHVDPACHGGGIGRTLLDHAVGLIGGDAFLLCLLENRRAAGFYVRLGWRNGGRESERIGGADYPAIRFLAPEDDAIPVEGESERRQGR